MKVASILFSLFFILLIDCQAQTLLHTDAFKAKLTDNKNAQLLDVRTPGEYKEGHLANAVNIDYKNEAFREKIALLDKSRPVFVYCLAGARSAAASKILKENGFKEIYDMQGGYLKWTSSGKLVEAPANSSSARGMTSSDFQKLVRSKNVVLIDFYAPWCQPCVKMLPTIHKLTNEYQAKAKIETIQYDTNKAIAKELGIEEIPAFLLYKNGKLVQRRNGLMEESDFKKWIDSNL
ncbi:Thiosulfate sulfurtransferase GlpE [Dyadobacter sp. CECT 9275]|uniref:Thiosulfate sulfurtransferase GlpE n=1 Tax=Dyadobacter helix TaxID=2822344 RepID=A0A916J6P1_9BACT|nr:thioredoxin domain-containing protein [Dyadobacter sp. CECT 9275]CAG4989176.1 Thiosulfate sulfurtransferase GlpE [Dyadobacter sp. CECT 9275]